MSLEYKNYYIKGDGRGMYTISNVGKGVLPVLLRGLYTSQTFAIRQIDDYVEARSEKDAKTNSGS